MRKREIVCMQEGERKRKKGIKKNGIKRKRETEREGKKERDRAKNAEKERKIKSV